MSITRRKFVATTSLGLACGPVLSAESTPPFAANLSAWIATLLPGDDSAPSALDLSLPAQILEKAARFPYYTALLTQGFAWTDSQAALRGSPTFAALDEANRIEIIEYSETAEPGSGPRLLFDHLHTNAIALYHGSAESWAAVGFPHAPQPLGFLDFADAPA